MFVPAKENMIKKIAEFHADAYIFDLEDAIEKESKKEALNTVANYMALYKGDVPLYVRLNAKTFQEEAECLSVFSNVGFVLPKFERVDFYSGCCGVWKEHDVIALIETPRGIVNINEIANCDWVNALAFGAEDYTSMVHMKNASELLLYQKECIITYAKAYGKKVYDTPSFDINCGDMFNRDVESSVQLGFDGKFAIHPKQIEYINACYDEIVNEETKQIIAQYEMSEDAVQVINGRVYERMHIEHLKDMLNKDRKKSHYI